MLMFMMASNMLGYFLMILSKNQQLSTLGFLLKFGTGAFFFVHFFYGGLYYMVLNCLVFLWLDYMYYREKIKKISIS